MNNIQSVSQKRSIQLNEILNNSKNKSIFVGAITILLFIILMIFGVIPSLSAVLSQNQENQVISEVIDQAKTKISLMNKLITEQSTKQDVLGTFKKVFPDDLGQVDLIGELYDLAGNSVTLESVGFPAEYPVDSSEISSNEKVRQVNISLVLYGTKKNLIDYLLKIEESRRIMSITSMSLVRQSDEVIEERGFDREFEMTVLLNYYYWSNQALVQ